MLSQKSIENTTELYRKLERTFDRRPVYGEHQIDWVFDFAITAWHMVDWISAINKLDLKETQEQFRIKCPELVVCEQICNGAKHFVLNDKKLKPFNVATDIQGSKDLMGIRTNVIPDEESVDVILTPAVLINDKDGNPWQAITLFQKVLSFWQSFLNAENL